MFKRRAGRRQRIRNQESDMRRPDCRLEARAKSVQTWGLLFVLFSHSSFTIFVLKLATTFKTFKNPFIHFTKPLIKMKLQDNNSSPDFLVEAMDIGNKASNEGVEIKPMDVLCGRGKNSFNHGTLTLNNIIQRTEEFQVH